MQRILSSITGSEFSNLLDAKIWLASNRILGTDLDEVFAWAESCQINIVCQGLLQVPLVETEYKSHDSFEKWVSVWIFENRKS